MLRIDAWHDYTVSRIRKALAYQDFGITPPEIWEIQVITNFSRQAIGYGCIIGDNYCYHIYVYAMCMTHLERKYDTKMNTNEVCQSIPCINTSPEGNTKQSQSYIFKP